MNKFMFALENFITSIGSGSKAIVNRKYDAVKSKVMLYHAIDYNASNYFVRNSNKKTSNRRK